MTEGRQSLGYRLTFRNWQISTKLLVVTLRLSILPLLVAIAITNRASSNALTDQTRLSLSRLAYSVAQRITQSLVDKEGLLLLAAGDPAVAELLTGQGQPSAELRTEGQRVIKGLLSASKAVDVVGIYNPKGTALAQSDPNLVGRHFAARDFVKAGLAGENFTSPFRVDAVNDTPGLNLSVPVRKDSGVVGVIAVRVKGAVITSMLSDSLSAQGQDVSEREQAAVRAFLVNEQGIVVGESSNTGWLGQTLLDANSPDLLSRFASARPLGVTCPSGQTGCDPSQKIPGIPEQAMAAQQLGDTLVGALQAGEAGSYRYCRPEVSSAARTGTSDGDCPGGRHVVGYAPVRTPSQTQSPRSQSANLLMAVVDVPESVFLESVSRQRAFGLTIAAIIAMVTVVAALLLAGALSRPIKRLAAVSQEVESDKPFEPAGIADLAGSGDEVGREKDVHSIVGTEYFQQLREKARRLRFPDRSSDTAMQSWVVALSGGPWALARFQDGGYGAAHEA